MNDPVALFTTFEAVHLEACIAHRTTYLSEALAEGTIDLIGLEWELARLETLRRKIRKATERPT